MVDNSSPKRIADQLAGTPDVDRAMHEMSERGSTRPKSAMVSGCLRTAPGRALVPFVRPASPNLMSIMFWPKTSLSARQAAELALISDHAVAKRWDF